MPAKQSQSATTKRTHPSGQPELQDKPNSWRPNEPTAVRSVRRALQNKPNLVTERNLHERHLAAALIPGDEKRSAPRRCLATRKNEPTVATRQRKQRRCFPPSEYFRKKPIYSHRTNPTRSNSALSPSQITKQSQSRPTAAPNEPTRGHIWLPPLPTSTASGPSASPARESSARSASP